jgi:hypothetical protein
VLTKLIYALFLPRNDLFSEVSFCDFSCSLRICISDSSGAILNFSKDFKSFAFALVEKINLVLTTWDCTYPADFAIFCGCVTQLISRGRGRQVGGDYTVEVPWPERFCPHFSAFCLPPYSTAMGRSTHRFVGNPAHRP